MIKATWRGICPAPSTLMASLYNRNMTLRKYQLIRLSSQGSNFTCSQEQVHCSLTHSPPSSGSPISLLLFCSPRQYQHFANSSNIQGSHIILLPEIHATPIIFTRMLLNNLSCWNLLWIVVKHGWSMAVFHEYYSARHSSNLNLHVQVTHFAPKRIIRDLSFLSEQAVGARKPLGFIRDKADNTGDRHCQRQCGQCSQLMDSNFSLAL